MKNNEKDELWDLFVAFVAVSLASTIAFYGIEGIKNFAYMALAVGSGFIGHELAHRMVAHIYGAKARFVKWSKGLFFMLLMSFAGVLFAAPGAVYIYGKLNKIQNGIISLAGPFSNIIIGIVFLALSLIKSLNIFYFGAKINFFLAFFNLLPIMPLDGAKVIKWNVFVWILFEGISAFLSFLV